MQEASAVTPVTACQPLTIPGETYVVQNDIPFSGRGTCLSVDGVDNVTLDGNGFSLIGDGSRVGVGFFNTDRSTLTN